MQLVEKDCKVVVTKMKQVKLTLWICVIQPGDGTTTGEGSRLYSTHAEEASLQLPGCWATGMRRQESKLSSQFSVLQVTESWAGPGNMAT